MKQMLNNTLRLNWCYLKIIHILHPRHHPKIIWHILKNKQASLYSWDYAISHNENEDENEKRSHIYSINRRKSRHRHKYSKCKKCPIMMMLISIKQHLSNIEAHFIKTFSNTEAQLKKKKALPIKKSVY